MRRIFAALFLALLPESTARAQTLSVNTLAGSTTGGGYVDGFGSSARFSLPRSVDYDSAGNFYVVDAANHVIRKVTPVGEVSTFAGVANEPGIADGIGAGARFDYPRGIAVDRARNVIYVADASNSTIRRMTLEGVVTTLAGLAGTTGTSNGTGSAVRFTFPRGLAVDVEGNVIVADTGNHVIRKVTPQGVVTTLAGVMRSSGSADGFGSQASFNQPYDVALDPATGNFYISDAGNDTIRKLTPEGRVTTVAGDANDSGDRDGTGIEARFSFPWGIDLDSDGNVYIADNGNQKIRRMTPAAVVTTFAGNGSTGASNGAKASARFSGPSGLVVAGDGTTVVVADGYNHALRFIRDGQVSTFAGSMPANGTVNATGTNARFHFPYGVVTDAAGNTFVAETGGAIRKITPDGHVTTFAGAPGQTGAADGTGVNARFNDPSGLTIDRQGNLYVADTYNHTIRKITPQGVVTTLAGKAGESGFQNGSGSQARFSFPWGVAVDAQGNIYVADTYNHSIRMVEPAGVVTTFAGNSTAGYYDGVGTNADFRYPIAITVDAARNLYVADWGNDVIRRITQAGSVTTVAGKGGSSGSADGSGANARFDGPSGIVSDESGTLYVADEANHAIRRVTPLGAVTTVAGLAGTPGNLDGGGPAARFCFPQGLALTPQGALVIADLYNHSIRIASPAPPSIDRFDATPTLLTAPGQSATIIWATRDATTIAIQPGIGAVAATGSRTVTPATTTTYILTATGPGGTATGSVTIYVGGAGKRRSVGH